MKQKRIRHLNIPKSVLEAEHSLEDFIQINPFVDIRTIRERIRLRTEKEQKLNPALPTISNQ